MEEWQISKKNFVFVFAQYKRALIHSIHSFFCLHYTTVYCIYADSTLMVVRF